jgi:hypothetical protein
VSDFPSSPGWPSLHAMSRHLGSGSSTFRKEEIAVLELDLAVPGKSDLMHALIVACSLVAYVLTPSTEQIDVKIP